MRWWSANVKPLCPCRRAAWAEWLRETASAIEPKVDAFVWDEAAQALRPLQPTKEKGPDSTGLSRPIGEGCPCP